MHCSYCGKNIESNSVTDDNLVFCNNLCRHLWFRNNNSAINNEQSDSSEVVEQKELSGIFLSDLDFNINLDNQSDKKLLLRANFFIGPQLYLNDKKLKPVKKERFKRIKIYHVPNEAGNYDEIKLKLRPLDAIPELFVNGEKTEIVKKIAWYEYLLIGFPILLLFFGGMIGAVIGSANLFTNTILLRKIKPKLFRYGFIIINTFIAVIIFFRVIIFVTPFLTELRFKAATFSSSEKKSSEVIMLTKSIWETFKVTDLENTDVSSKTKLIIGCKRYFFPNGEYFQLMSDNTFMMGKWKYNADEKWIYLEEPGGTEKVKIITISDDELVIRYENVDIHHIAV